MKIIIDISEHDKEWITNGYCIPQELNADIARKIIEAESVMNFTKEDFTEEELKLLRVIFKTTYTWLDHAISYEFDRNTLYYLLNKLGIYDLVRD